MASQPAHLVVKGNKRGTDSWVESYLEQGLTVPMRGQLSMVTDGLGIPVCAIRTQAVERLPFRDVTPEMVQTDGEGDLSLEDWKRGHWISLDTVLVATVEIPIT